MYGVCQSRVDMSLSTQRCVSIQFQLLTNVMADHRGIIANGAQPMYPFCTPTMTAPSCGFNVHTYAYAFKTGGASNFRVVVVDVLSATLCNMNKVLYGLQLNGAYH